MPLYLCKGSNGLSICHSQKVGQNGEIGTHSEIRFRPKRNQNKETFGVYSTTDEHEIEVIEGTDDFKRGYIVKAEGEELPGGRSSFVMCPYCQKACRTAEDLAKHLATHSTKEQPSELRPVTAGGVEKGAKAAGKF